MLSNVTVSEYYVNTKAVNTSEPNRQQRRHPQRMRSSLFTKKWTPGRMAQYDKFIASETGKKIQKKTPLHKKIVSQILNFFK